MGRLSDDPTQIRSTPSPAPLHPKTKPVAGCRSHEMRELLAMRALRGLLLGRLCGAHVLQVELFQRIASSLLWERGDGR